MPHVTSYTVSQNQFHSQPYSAFVLADSPTIYYPMQETSGTVMNDSSGNSNPGTYVSGTGLGNANALVFGDSFSVYYPSLGKTSTISSNGVRTGSWTCEIWCSPQVGRLVGGIANRNILLEVSAADAVAHTGMVLYVGTDGITIASNSSGGLTTLINVGVSISSTNSSYVVVTKNSTTLTLYLNGSSIGTHAVGAGFAAPLTIGDRTNTIAINSYMSEFAFYQSALSIGSIVNHYNAGI